MDYQVAVIGPLKAADSIEASAYNVNDSDAGNCSPLPFGSVHDPEFHAIGEVTGESK
jgi:hypothetical protein